MRWNIARVLEDLDRGDEFTRLTTIFGFSDHLPCWMRRCRACVKRCTTKPSEFSIALTATLRLIGLTGEHVTVATCESLLRQDPADLAVLSCSSISTDLRRRVLKPTASR